MGWEILATGAALIFCVLAGQGLYALEYRRKRFRLAKGLRPALGTGEPSILAGTDYGSRISGVDGEIPANDEAFAVQSVLEYGAPSDELQQLRQYWLVELGDSVS